MQPVQSGGGQCRGRGLPALEVLADGLGVPEIVQAHLTTGERAVQRQRGQRPEHSAAGPAAARPGHGSRTPSSERKPSRLT